MKFKELKSQVSSKLNGYKVFFSPAEVPVEILFPEQWSDFGLLKNVSPKLPKAWSVFSDRLPWVCDWLQKCVVGTVLVVGKKTYLGYVYLEDEEVYIYLGGAPLKNISAADKAKIPSLLVDFYVNLHDGFGFYIGMSMGPSPVEDFLLVQELCEEELDFLPPLISFFSSGAGDYLAMAVVSGREVGYVWWHENPRNPEENIDVWAVMNTWMAIFLENCDSNERVFLE